MTKQQHIEELEKQLSNIKKELNDTKENLSATIEHYDDLIQEIQDNDYKDFEKSKNGQYINKMIKSYIKNHLKFDFDFEEEDGRYSYERYTGGDLNLKILLDNDVIESKSVYLSWPI